MINRILIRIKVVQLLYSYLLSQSEFKIEPPIENPSRDKKYGHDLYEDLLMLVLELSGYDVSVGRRESPLRGIALNKHLNHNLLAKSLNSIEEVRTIIMRGHSGVEAFDVIVPAIYDAIPNLPAYKSYIRIKKPELKDDVALWVSIIENLIAKNPEFIAVARKNPEFTLAGFTRGINSIISTLNDYKNNRTLYLHVRNALDYSLDKAHELYYSLLQLSEEITRMQDLRLDAAKHKLLPTDEDLHPNLRFVENKFVKALTENPGYHGYIEKKKLSWDADDVLVRSLLETILQSDTYKEYMEKPGETTFGEDSDFWRLVYKNIILPSDELADALESKSVFWNDDMHVMGTFVIKTLRKYCQSVDGSDVVLLPKYKDDEDETFGSTLFEAAVKNYDEYRALIDSFVNTNRWDSDRLAFMDIVIMVAAIAELREYHSIPIAVTLNEYIEIANAYSTPKSGAFINGILYSVIQKLKDDGLLMKC